jgi:hypothetical protein
MDNEHLNCVVVVPSQRCEWAPWERPIVPRNTQSTNYENTSRIKPSFNRQSRILRSSLKDLPASLISSFLYIYMKHTHSFRSFFLIFLSFCLYIYIKMHKHSIFLSLMYLRRAKKIYILEMYVYTYIYISSTYGKYVPETTIKWSAPWAMRRMSVSSNES